MIIGLQDRLVPAMALSLILMSGHITIRQSHKARMLSSKNKDAFISQQLIQRLKQWLDLTAIHDSHIRDAYDKDDPASTSANYPDPLHPPAQFNLVQIGMLAFFGQRQQFTGIIESDHL